MALNGLNEKQQLFEIYKRFIDFLGDFLGNDYELVLHDTDNVENSIVYIKNSFSARKIGGSITELGLRFIKEKTYEGENYCVNYSSKLSDGRTIRSATYFIKDSGGKLAGLLCINVDVTKAMLLDDYIQEFIRGQKTLPPIKDTQLPYTKGGSSQTLSDSIEDVAQEMINGVISGFGIPVERMSLDEKKEAISQLDGKGLFLIKGSVKSVSARLQVSEATVYRCISSGK